MKNLTKTALTLLAASVITTSAFAAGDNDNVSDRVNSARADVEALSVTLENMGATVDTSVNLNGAKTPYQKEAAYNAKIAELQAQFNKLHSEL